MVEPKADIFADNALMQRARRLNGRYLVGQRRKCGEDATKHCHRVAVGVYELGADYLSAEDLERASLAGELHDVIEDGAEWANKSALEAVRAEIIVELEAGVLQLVEGVTVDPRLAPKTRFAEFQTRVVTWGIAECLIKWVDIIDNAHTRYVYAVSCRVEWEQYAEDMLRNLIPRRLRELGWQGELPPAHLPPNVDFTSAPAAS